MSQNKKRTILAEAARHLDSRPSAWADGSRSLKKEKAEMIKGFFVILI